MSMILEEELCAHDIDQQTDVLTEGLTNRDVRTHLKFAKNNQFMQALERFTQHKIEARCK